jgi:tetratricopeptide (TPR) repeat protein
MRVLSEGTRLADRYTLIRRTGRGGMAEIWLARDRQAESVVALKFLAPQRAGHPAARDRLHKEWRIGSRLMHAHIVRVFEFHDDPDGAYFSLQYIDGPELSVLAGAEIDNALRPLGLLADALRYAHAKGVVHGDIKASNVLLDSRGAPYLVDFGVASLPAVDGEAQGGSAINRSPQLKAGAAPQAADDIYAFGMLLGEMVSGAPPGADRPVPLRCGDGTPSPTVIVELLNDMLADDAAERPDAETVGANLAAAGFPPGPARIKTQAAAAPHVQEAVESIRAVQRQAKRPAPAVPNAAIRDSGGLSARLFYWGLGASMLLLVAVVFLLPQATDESDGTTTVTESDVPVSAAGDVADVAPQGDTVDETMPEDLPQASAPRTDAGFNENLDDYSGDRAGSVRAATDEALGDLLSHLERLRYRAIDRWGGQQYLDALNVYEAGDDAYLNKNYATALRQYQEAIKMLDPFFDRIDTVFRDTLAAAREAFSRGDHLEAIRLYDLAAAITPGNADAERGLARARNLEAVMSLTDQGLRYEHDLELDAARLSFEKALELDAVWEPAATGLERVRVAIREATFNQRMTEGFDALAAGYYDSARAAFNAAKAIDPQSREAADGLLQVDQELRLQNIRNLERQSVQQVDNEQWEAAVDTYRALLEIDADLQFARDGLAEANRRVALHNALEGYIVDPDSLSSDVTMQKATRLLLDISRMPSVGPRLVDQKEELSRLLKRAATPLNVQLVSDGVTEVSVYKVGQFGSFTMQELNLRPGVYVAVGNRPGFRDVRLEFRVAPEIEMKPIVIQCEERI